MGPGPETLGSGAIGGGAAAAAVKVGDGRDGSEALALLTVYWFEGRMFRDGDPADWTGTGGGGIWWEEERREAFRGCGEAGTVLRSGMVDAEGGDDAGW